MPTDRSITREEYEVVNNVAAGFMRRVHSDPRWEKDDITQELLVFWIKKKQSGWPQFRRWKGLMGQCLLMHLISLWRKEISVKRQSEGPVLSLDELIEKGREFPDQRPTPIPLDFLALLDQQEREICELLIQGYTRSEIGSRINLSRQGIHRRIVRIRKLCEQFS
jgi:DNA-directed RNA polymerase specialized sigma24 family protein